MQAVIMTCKINGSALSVFSGHEITEANLGKELYDKLMSVKNLTIYPTLPFKQYQEELKKCSVTIPLAFAGSTQEAVFYGLVPLLYNDSMFSSHPDIDRMAVLNTCSRFVNAEDEKNIIPAAAIGIILEQLTEDQDFYEEHLNALRPMVIDNIDSNVNQQLEAILNHKGVQK